MKKILMIVLVVSGFLLPFACKPEEKKEVAAIRPRPVRTELIAARDLPLTVESVGRLNPNREVVISSQVPGIIEQYRADVGTPVAAGQVLVKLDPTDYTLALNEAKANLLSARARLAAAESTFERARRLLPEKVITPELYDRSEAEYKSSQASTTQLEVVVKLAERRLEKTIVTTPFDGFVTRRFVELGQNVGVAEPVMQVADMETMRVKIHINERDYVHLDTDDPVTVTIEAYPETPFTGRVDKIGIQADPRTNSFEIEILVENPQFQLKAGLTARVSIQTEVIPDTIMVAQNCILFRENGTEVFVIEDGEVAAVRRVTLGQVDGSAVRILDGLAPGDHLVVSGGQYLKVGDKVLIAQ